MNTANNEILNEKQESVTSYGLNDDDLKNLIFSIESDNKQACLSIIKDVRPADIASVLDIVSSECRASLIKIIKNDFDPEILVEVNEYHQEEVINSLGTKKAANIIGEMETDDAIDVMENLSTSEQQTLLDAMPTKYRNELEEGLSYPEDSAGRLLEKKIVSVPQFWTVDYSLKFLKKSKNLPKDFYYVFVLDAKLAPVGVISLSKLLNADSKALISDIMDSDVKIIHTDMDQEEVAYLFKKYRLLSAPVVDSENKIIGAITLDDIIDVIDEEAQEDILHLGGVSETDLHSNFKDTLKKRFPWLFVNLITAVIASIVIALFEDEITKLASLAVLMPIVASMGGNSGTQTLTISVRAIASKELTSTNAKRILGKEICVGGINGIVFAVITAIASFMFYQNFMLSVIFAVAIIITLLLAGVAGTAIPLILNRFGVDPALASGVFLTTITDVLAFASFLGIAAFIF